MVFEFKLPDLGEGIHEAEVLAVKVKEGDTIKEDQALFEVETDKAVVEIPSPVAGTVSKVLVKNGQSVKVGNVMIAIEEKNGSVQKEKAEKKDQSAIKSETAWQPQVSKKSIESSERTEKAVIASPATRQLARELKIDLHKVNGSGPGGKISKEDLLIYVEQIKSDKTSAAAATVENVRANMQEEKLPDFAKLGEIERVPLRSLRRRTAQMMALSWEKIPHVTHADEANVTALEKYRLQHQHLAEPLKTKITLNAFIMKAVSLALQKFPELNTSLDEKAEEIIFKRYYNLGMAVATDRGLMVPVVKSVNTKSIIELAVEIAELAQKARAGKIELNELQGATFTITNIGSIGGTFATPIIHYPEAAILAVMKTSERAIIKNGKIEAASILPLCLTFDHRLSDGAEAARFLRLVIDMLEQPASFEKYMNK